LKAFAIVALWAAAVAPASAVLLPPQGPSALPRGLSVLDESDAAHDLRGLWAGTPRLLLPIFTRCGSTCPLTALVLKDALARTPVRFRVVVLSFDPDDSASDLKRFRTRLALPADWMLVRATDAAKARAFLDEVGFRLRKAEGGFDHPNQTFVFSAEGAWTGTFAGSAFRDDELRAAWRRALSSSHPTALGRLEAWVVRPEAWIAIACVGLALVLSAIALVARRTRATTSPDP
jgi:cytochrome oxidase Cu insertion factor (SCO1/SenC/PrrC family)